MKSLLCAAATAALVLAGTAGTLAADLLPASALPPAPELPALYSWSGAYLGAQAGYSWGSGRVAQAFAAGGGTVQRFHPGSALGGLQAGFNYQIGPLVVGAEGDAELIDAENRIANAAGFGHVRQDWQASVRGRLGYAFDTVLVYATGGAAFTGFETRYTEAATGAFASATSSRTGWTVGGGVNYALTDHVVLGTEYRYTDYGRFTQTLNLAFPAASRQETTMHSLRASLAYKF